VWDELLVFAQAVEEKKEEHGDERVDEGGDNEVHVKPGLGCARRIRRVMTIKPDG